MDIKKILIVTCGWQCGPFVERCFNSIKAQTYKNFTVVAVDDCSPDNTYQQMKAHMEEGWVCLQNTRNRGGQFSYNLGVKVGSMDCDIICFLGLDDFLEPNALELTIKEYDKGKYHTYSAYKNNDGFVFTDLFYSDVIAFNRDYRKDKYRCTGFTSCLKEMYLQIEFPDQGEVERNIYYNLEHSMSLLEMAGPFRIGVITEPIYNYNNDRKDNIANRFGRSLAVYNEIMNRPKRKLYEGA